MVDSKVVGFDINERDAIEKLEDPFDLYDDNSEEDPSGVDDRKLSEVIKEEKKRLKAQKQNVKKTLKSSRAIFSPWRLIPYAILVVSFFILRNNHMLDISGFLIGVGTGVVSAGLIGQQSLRNQRDI